MIRHHQPSYQMAVMQEHTAKLKTTTGYPVLSDQIRAQYAKNAAQLQEMADSATHHPSGKHRGKSAAYWQSKADTYHKVAKTGIPCKELEDMMIRCGVISESANPGKPDPT